MRVLLLLLAVIPLAAEDLVFPWISNRDGQFESIVVINNHDDRPLTFTLTARRSHDQQETVNRSVPAKGFLEERASALFPTLGSGVGYSVNASTDSAMISGTWITLNLQSESGASPSQGNAILRQSVTHQSAVFHYVPMTGNWISALVLTNLGDLPADINLAFFNDSGFMVDEITLDDVEPLIPFARVVGDMISYRLGDLYVIARSTQPLSGVNFIFDQVFLEPAIGNASGFENPSSALLFPWVSNRTGVFESMMIINNLGSSRIDMTLIARRDQQSQNQERVIRSIAPGGFLAESASSLFPEMGSGDGYTVHVETSSAVLSGAWITNNLLSKSGHSPSMGVAIHLDHSPLRGDGMHHSLGYLPGDGVQSAPVIVNIGDCDTNIHLRFRDHQGREIGSSDRLLEQRCAFRPFAELTSALVAGHSGSVHLVAQSDKAPIAGVTFSFNGAFNEPSMGNSVSIALPEIPSLVLKPPFYADRSQSHLSDDPASGASMDAHSADLDRDGDMDIIVASEFQANRLLLNDGSGVMVDASDRLPRHVHDSEDIAIADFDGDGDLDIVVVSEDDQINELYLNDGSAHFQTAGERLPVTGTSNAVVTADINGDGAWDLLIGNNGSNKLLINDGNALFRDESGNRLPNHADITQDIELGDVDGDGDLDLVVANENQNRLLINTGDGFYRDESSSRLPMRANSEETREADFGDVDDDGDLDLFFANVAFSASDAGNRLLINDGAGFFSDQTEARLHEDEWSTLDGDFIDLDGDCDLDLITANVDVSRGFIDDAPYLVFLNDDGFFTLSNDVLPAASQGRGLDVEAVDLNGDGIRDLYLCSRGGPDQLLIRKPQETE